VNSFKRQTIYNTSLYLARIIVYGIPYVLFRVKQKFLNNNKGSSFVWRTSRNYTYRVRDKHGNEFLICEPEALVHVVNGNYKLIHKK